MFPEGCNGCTFYRNIMSKYLQGWNSAVEDKLYVLKHFY